MTSMLLWLIFGAALLGGHSANSVDYNALLQDFIDETEAGYTAVETYMGNPDEICYCRVPLSTTEATTTEAETTEPTTTEAETTEPTTTEAETTEPTTEAETTEPATTEAETTEPATTEAETTEPTTTGIKAETSTTTGFF